MFYLGVAGLLTLFIIQSRLILYFWSEVLTDMLPIWGVSVFVLGFLASVYFDRWALKKLNIC